MAPGLAILRSAAQRLGSVHVVAPDREQSATSHSLTLHLPLRARTGPRRRFHSRWYTHGLRHPRAQRASGASARRSVSPGSTTAPTWERMSLYSGTVAAAMEATVLGIPSVAVSYAGRDLTEGLGWSEPLSDLLRQVLARPFPTDTLFNVNLPPVSPAEAKGVRITRLGRRRYSDSLLPRPRPDGEGVLLDRVIHTGVERLRRFGFPCRGGGIRFGDPAPPRPHQPQASRRGAGVGSDDVARSSGHPHPPVPPGRVAVAGSG